MDENGTPSREDLARKTLESKLYKEAVGISEARSNPFSAGRGAYEFAVNYSPSGDFKGLVDGTRSQMIKERKRRSIEGGDVSIPTDSEVYGSLGNIVNESMAVLSLDALYSIAKDAGADLDFEVPSELKDIKYTDYVEKAINEKGEFDSKRLDDTEIKAFNLYQTVSFAYRTAAMNNLRKKADYAPINSIGKKIEASYKPDDSKSDSGEGGLSLTA